MNYKVRGYFGLIRIWETYNKFLIQKLFLKSQNEFMSTYFRKMQYKTYLFGYTFKLT